MDKWGRSGTISYKRWRNSEPRGEGDFAGQSDEHQISDNEICTIASTAVNSLRRGSVSTKSEETFTLDDALDACGFGKFQWKICLFTGLSWIGDAMELMLLSVLSPQLRCEWVLFSYEVALIVSIVFIGMSVGSPIWGNISDKYGRRVCLLICMCWTSYFGLLSAFAPVYGWLIFLRCLVGVGLGAAPQSVTMYSEFLPMKSRGSSVMLTAVFWSIGAVLEVLLAMLVMPTLGWRWLLGISTLPMALFVFLCCWLPESPRFDSMAGNRARAMATLTHIAKANGKTLPQGKLVISQQRVRGRIKDLFLPQYRKTTLLLLFIWMDNLPSKAGNYLRRFANAFSYYGIVLLTTEMFQYGYACGETSIAEFELSCGLECNYLTVDDYKGLLWTTMAEFPGLLVIIFLIDRIGRKRSLALCFAVFSLSILPMFACIGRIPLSIFIFIARAFISGGFQVAFVYTPEVFPTENRALAMGTCSAMSKIGALITPFVAQVLLKASVYLALATYCVFCVIATVASLLLPIETLGRGLQESSLDQEAREQRNTINDQLDCSTPSMDPRA